MELSEFRVSKTDSCQNRGYDRAQVKERKVRKGAGLNLSRHQEAQQELRLCRLIFRFCFYVI